MIDYLTNLWRQSFVRTFLTGLFAILPLAITLWIMNWVAGFLRDAVGPETIIGRNLQSLGMQFAANEYIATVFGWFFVLAGIWMIGVLVSSTARNSLLGWTDLLMKRIPLVNSVYGPVKQVVEMFGSQDESAVKGMQVVHCAMGGEQAPGFLCLLPSEDIYQFQGQDCHIVYLPSAPMPMTGFNLFVPIDKVVKIEMGVEELMQVYLSLGVMTTSALPDGIRKASI